MNVIVAITGASGINIAIKLLEILGKQKIQRHLIISKNAFEVQKYEYGKEVCWEKLSEKLYDLNDISSNLASGSYPITGMIVVPCSMNTLGHIANGLENNLITRAVAVNLKQERKVILVPRETPLSLMHIENMRKAKLAGCSILPPNLSFYFNPKTIDDIINHIVGKILELLNIEQNLYKKWEKS